MRLFSRRSLFTLSIAAAARFAFAQAPDPDLNNDGIVNILDVSRVSSCIGKTPPRPPQISDLVPADGAILRSSPISISGRVSGSISSVTVNGVPAAVTGESFLAQGVILQDGANAVTIAATTTSDNCIVADTDADGDVDLIDLDFVRKRLGQRGFPVGDPIPTTRTATVTISIVLDTTAPIVTPPQDLVVAATSADGTPRTNAQIAAFLLAATGVDNIDGNVTVTNDAPVLFSIGEKTVTFSATDTAGNTGSASAKVTVLDFVPTDTTPPVITGTFDPPAGVSGWHRTDVTVTFECFDGGSGIASCTGELLVQTEGAQQEIVGTAVDRASNAATATVTLNIDKTPPVEAFTIAPPASVAPGGTVNFSVTVTDNLGVASVAVSVNGTTIETRDAGPYDFSVQIAEDTELGTNNVIAVFATDLAGNSTVIQTTVTVNVSQLSLSVVPPASPTFKPSEVISGSLGDALGSSTITVTGGASAANQSLASGQTQFGLDVPLRPNAENVLKVTATDSAGQTVSASNLRVIQLSLSSLVTAQVTVQRLTTAQVEALVANGTISLSDPANFNVSTFVLSLIVVGKPAPVTVPLHVIKPIDELVAMGPEVTLECGDPKSDITETATGFSIPCDDKDRLPPLPQMKIVPFAGSIAGAPSLSGVIVLDGQIKTLKEFFKATLLLTNVSTNFTLAGLSAKITIPDGGLSPVAPASGAIAMDDLVAGAQGSGDFIIRGDLIGTHAVTVNFGGQVTGGGLSGPVPFSGSASTSVEVKGPPNLNVTVAHPEEVTAGIPYTLTVNVQDTSTIDALYASLELDLGGVADLIDPTTGIPFTGANIASLGHILAGETVSQNYTVVPRISGRITSCVGGATVNIKLSVVFSGNGAPICAIGTLPSQVVSPSGQPTVTVLPAPNTTNVPLNAAISALFSDAIQKQTLTLGSNGTFRLADDTGALVAGELQFSSLTNGATAAVFRSSSPLKGSTTYTIFISPDIFDVNGAHLASGITSSFTTAPPPPADTTAPQVTMQIKPPIDPAAIAKGQLVSIFVDSSDDSDVVARLGLQIDGELVDARGPVSSVTFLVDTSELEPDSSHVLTAVATDPAGNSASASVNVSIVDDSNPPTVSLTAAPRLLRGQSFPISIEANDDVRVARVDVFLDGGADPVYSGSIAPYQFSFNTMSLASGSHRLLALVTDGAGNTAQASQALSVVSLTGLAISPAPVTISGIDATQALVVAGTFSDGSVAPITSGLTFLSTDTSRATVSSAGVVTAVAPGTATISAAVQLPTPLVATVSVTVVAGDPTTLTLVSGDQQTAVAGQLAPAPLIVRVRDANGHPVPGVGVNFQAVTGGGTLTAADTNTDNEGRASTTLTLGQAPGSNVVIATAGTLAGSPVTFHVRGISNQPPVLTNPGNQSSTQGTVASLQLTGSDPNGDPLTYSVTGLPASLSINSATGLIDGTLSVTTGAYPVTVTASNGTLSSSLTFTWTVTAPLTPFVDIATTIDPSQAVVSLGSSVTYTVTVSNLGTAAATDVVTTDVLPSALAFVSASADCAKNGGTISCTDAILAPAQVVTHTITAVPYAAGRMTNGVTVSSAQADVASINNTANAVITVVATPPGAPGLVPTGAAEVFTPANSSWSPTGGMSIPRGGATLTVLGDGTVLVLGGINASTSAPSAVATGELYDPTTGTWTATASLAAPRAFHTATLLPTGGVLISGGVDGAGDPVATSEVYRGPPIQKVAPILTWATPESIAHGAPLGAAQLNASSNVSGIFTYGPPAGTILAVGTHILSVGFVPSDTIHFASVTATVTLTVTP